MGSDKQSIYPLNGDEGYEDALATEIALKWADLLFKMYIDKFSEYQTNFCVNIYYCRGNYLQFNAKQ
jgi:hypothetical protein